MLTTLILASLLSAPQPAPVAPLAGPTLTMATPAWAFSPMAIADEPTMPMLPEWVDFVEAERSESIMASVTPFEGEDAADPFEGQ